MRRQIITILAAFVYSGSAFAQQAVPSLLVNTDPAALSHAGASVAQKADAFALENNTAAMSFYEGHLDVAASYSLWQPKTAKEGVLGIGVFGKLGKLFALGFTFESLSMPQYDIFDENGIKPQVGGTFKPAESNFALGASCKILPFLSAGVNLRLAFSKLAPEAKAAVFASDIYVALDTKKGVRAGLGVCNLGGKAKYGESEYAIPSYLKAGIGYGIKGIQIDAEFDYTFKGAVMASGSLGYWFRDIVGVNAGYHFGSGNEGALYVPSYASAGIGANIKGIHLDFAYLFASKDLANSLSVSLGYRF